jgi:polysaccharide pyruvyl transferase WcaK-like protein
MMDFLLEAWVALLIERAKLEWILGFGRARRPGERLKLLLACYAGARNTGSDLRVEETIRQIRHILGAERVELSVTTQNFDLTRGYFPGATQVKLPDIFPAFLYRQVRRNDGAIACEGSMFKSTWADALTTMMVGSLGLAVAQNKLSVGYGGDADRMNPMLAWMCRRYCRQSFVIARSSGSQAALREQGIPAELGTDTAWTFESNAPEFGRQALRQAGWDGVTPVLVVCASDPFCWPVKPSLAKYLARVLTGAYKESQYRTIYFHKSGPEVDAALNRMLTGISKAVHAFRQRRKVFPIVVGTEQIDKKACLEVARQLGGLPVFTSDMYDMHQLVSILRAGQMVVSSRYHAIVTTMPSLVPSAGIAMDERIRNLMQERGQEDLLVNVDDSELEPKLIAAMERLYTDADSIREAMGRTVVQNLKRMARMGVFFERAVHECYPEFPIQGGIRSWEDYLPPLHPGLRQLVEWYDGRAQAMAAN